MKNNRKWFVLVSVLISTFIVVFKEWETLLHLNTSFFGNYHDALKNYYTVLYHIKWDESYRIFEGMNFPYGEHVLFTDNQPLLSTFLKFIHENLFPIAAYTLGIINGLMFLSLVLCTLFSHLCLQRLGVNNYLAIIVALGLTFLSPQLSRINAHYALSYSFIIPMLIYQGLLFVEKSQLRRSIFIALLVIAVSFLHAYYFGFGLVIFSGLFLVSLFYKRITTKSKILHFIIQVLIPLVMVELIMIMSDPIADRPSYPWSPYIHDYNIFNILSGIFFPIGKPMGGWLVQNFGIPLVDWEGVTYVGAFASLFFLISLFILPFFLLAGKARLNPLVNPDQKMNFLLAAGVLSVAISAAYSVLSSNVDLYQIMGPLRQFRAVTRFNWVFFFVLNFFAFAWLSQKLRDVKAVWKWILFLPAVGLLGFDAYSRSKASFHTNYSLELMTENTPAQKEMEQKLAEYDVMVPVPYFHIGSEDFLVMPDVGEHYRNAMAISYSSGLPMTAVMLSRTSLEQTLENLTYHLMPVHTPSFASYLENQKALLLIAKDQEYSPQEELLIRSGKDMLVQREDYYLKEFDLSTYLRLLEEKQSRLSYLKPDTAEVLLYQDYEEDTSVVHTGQGSLAIPQEMPREIGSFKIDAHHKDSIRIGFWIYLYQQTKALERVKAEIKDEAGEIISTGSYNIRKHLKAIDAKWGYVEIDMESPAEAFGLHLALGQNSLHPTTTYIDGLRIYTAYRDEVSRIQ